MHTAKGTAAGKKAGQSILKEAARRRLGMRAEKRFVEFEGARN